MGVGDIKSTMAEMREATGLDDIKSTVKEVREAVGVDELKSTVTEVRDAANLDLKSTFSLKDEAEKPTDAPTKTE